MGWYTAVLKNYVGFSGRARRKEYWMFFLFNLIIALALSVVGGVIKTMIPYFLYFAAVAIPSIAVGIRRLHDTGRSGFWMFFGLVPIVGGITLLVFCASEGNSGPNQYGPDPKALAV